MKYIVINIHLILLIILITIKRFKNSIKHGKYFIVEFV